MSDSGGSERYLKTGRSRRGGRGFSDIEDVRRWKRKGWWN